MCFCFYGQPRKYCSSSLPPIYTGFVHKGKERPGRGAEEQTQVAVVQRTVNPPRGKLRNGKGILQPK